MHCFAHYTTNPGDIGSISRSSSLSDETLSEWNQKLRPLDKMLVVIARPLTVA